MKKLIFTLLVWAAAFLVAPQSSAQTKIFKDAAAIKGVTSVYISPALLELGTDVGMLGYGLDDAVEELKGLELITANYALDQKSTVMDLCRKAYSSLNATLLVDITEEGESVKLFAQLEPGTTMARQLVLEINEEQDNYTVIYIRGKIDVSKIIKDNLKFK